MRTIRALGIMCGIFVVTICFLVVIKTHNSVKAIDERQNMMLVGDHVRVTEDQSVVVNQIVYDEDDMVKIVVNRLPCVVRKGEGIQIKAWSKDGKTAIATILFFKSRAAGGCEGEFVFRIPRTALKPVGTPSFF